MRAPTHCQVFSIALAWAISVSVIAPGSAPAADIEFVGYQFGPPGPTTDSGSWFHRDVWLNYAVPGADDRAIFGSGITPTCNPLGLPGHVYFGPFSFDDQGQSGQTFGGGSATVNALDIQNGTWTLHFEPGQSPGASDPPPGPNGSLTVTGTSLFVIGNTRSTSGGPGTAHVTVTGDGTLTTMGCRIGAAPDSQGTLVLSGENTVWNDPHNVSVGSTGQGQLLVRNGATLNVSGGNAICIGESGGTGTVRVADPGSLLSVYQWHWTFIGSQPGVQASLEVTAGGQANLGTTVIGDAEGTARVLVSDPESRFENSGQLWINSPLPGHHSLEVLHGATFISRDYIGVGTAVGAQPSVRIAGEDTTWDCMGWVAIAHGSQTQARVLIEDRAQATSGAITIGAGDQTRGVLTIRNAQLTQQADRSGELIAAGRGEGILNVEDGGNLESTRAYLADGWPERSDGARVSAAAHVTGPGSKWQIAEHLHVGAGYGTATLSITDHAEVRAQNVVVGRDADAVGIVRLSGDTPILAVANQLMIGGFPDAGVVTGDPDGAPGTVGLGDTSRLTVGHSIHLGRAGDFTLTGTIGSAVVGTADPQPGSLVVGPEGILSGFGTINASVVNAGGRISPGNPPETGRLTIAGDVQMSPAGTLTIDVSGLTPGSYDQLEVAGAATLGGRLQVNISAQAAQAGGTIPLLTAVSFNGAFDAFEAVGIDSARVQLLPTGELSIAPLPDAAKAPAGPGWSFETLESEGDVGFASCIRIGPLGYPRISYHDRTDRDLKYAEWDGAAWHVETANAAGDAGGYTSMILDHEYQPHIGYMDFADRSLHYAVRTEAGWSTEVVDPRETGGGISLAITPAGSPVLCYAARGSTVERFRTCLAERGASGWSITTLPDEGCSPRPGPSMAMDSDGTAHVAFPEESESGDRLRYAVRRNEIWSVSTVRNTLGQYTRLAVDSTGRFHIAYVTADNALDYAVQVNGGAWVSHTVDIVSPPGALAGVPNPGLAMDDGDRPHIVYYRQDLGDLRYAAWTGTEWSVETLQSEADVGWYPSIAFDSDGGTHVSYLDRTNLDLRYAYRTPMPDYDGDRDVDQDDCQWFSPCGTGPALLFDPASPPQGCKLALAVGGSTLADLDRDRDVDQEDFGILQSWLGWPPAPKPPPPGAKDSLPATGNRGLPRSLIRPVAIRESGPALER